MLNLCWTHWIELIQSSGSHNSFTVPTAGKRTWFRNVVCLWYKLDDTQSQTSFQLDYAFESAHDRRSLTPQRINILRHVLPPPSPPHPLNMNCNWKYFEFLHTYNRVHTGVSPFRGNGLCTECDKYCQNIYSHLNVHVTVSTTKENLERNTVCELRIILAC